MWDICLQISSVFRRKFVVQNVRYFQQSDSMYLFRDCHTTSRPLHISYFYAELEHLILHPLVACKSYSTKMTQFLKFRFMNTKQCWTQNLLVVTVDLNLQHNLCLDSTVARRNMTNFSDTRSHLSYCLLLDSFFGNHFWLLFNRFFSG